jgi:hypothetical protein
LGATRMAGVCRFENLYRALRKARRGKRHQENATHSLMEKPGSMKPRLIGLSDKSQNYLFIRRIW